MSSMSSIPPPPYSNGNPNSNVSIEDLLSGYDVILGLDQSGSMAGPVSKKRFGTTRWQDLREAVTSMASAIDNIDKDGSTVIFFNSEVSMFDHQTSEDIQELFKERKPSGLTNLTSALTEALKYFKRKYSKDKKYKSLMIFITDGVPFTGNNNVNEMDIVASLITDFTLYLEREGITDDQVGITFIQVGDDAGATQFLKFLDDTLTVPSGMGGKGAPFDIVDTINFEDVERAGGIVQAFLNAFND